MRKNRDEGREMRIAKEGFCLGELRQKKMRPPKKKKIILLRICAAYESIDGRMAARFGQMLGTRYRQCPCRHAASSISTAVRRRRCQLLVA